MPAPSAFINANKLTSEVLGQILIQEVSGGSKSFEKHFQYREKKTISKSFKALALRGYNHPNAICRLGYYYNSKRRWDNLPVGAKYEPLDLQSL
jgi:hypothetical protein